MTSSSYFTVIYRPVVYITKYDDHVGKKWRHDPDFIYIGSNDELYHKALTSWSLSFLTLSVTLSFLLGQPTHDPAVCLMRACGIYCISHDSVIERLRFSMGRIFTETLHNFIIDIKVHAPGTHWSCWNIIHPSESHLKLKTLFGLQNLVFNKQTLSCSYP